jgi:hypothetical protein
VFKIIQGKEIEEDINNGKKVKKGKKKIILQKDYMREPYINKLLMIGP